LALVFQFDSKCTQSQFLHQFGIISTVTNDFVVDDIADNLALLSVGLAYIRWVF